MALNSLLAASPSADAPPSNLPVVCLDAKQPINSDSRVVCSVRMLLPDGATPGQALAGGVRFHGASSQGYPKKSFGLALDTPVRWLGMRERAHWVLNAACVDRSLMRHKLSYDLFRSLSTTNAPRFAAASRFVELRLNGEYQGVYLLMERVDRSMLGLRPYATNASQHACIYKAVDHSAGFDHTGHGGFQQREPDPLTAGEYWKPLDEINRFVSSASEREFFDPVKGISTRVDIENTIDFHLLILLTSNMDGFDKNLILARDAPLTNRPPPRFFFVPWDYDATFGRNWEASPVRPTQWLSNHLFDRLLKDPSYRHRFAQRWQQLRQREFSVARICAMIDENAATVGAAAGRNAARWRALEGDYPDHLTFEEDVAEMKSWIAQRARFLDQQIGRLSQP
jgi:spore coat protein CotH